jgi:6-phosphogluconolactonase (cycloisomerase 2 family)
MTNYGAAEIQIPPTTPEFPQKFIYTSNRQIGGAQDPQGKFSFEYVTNKRIWDIDVCFVGDSIAIFSLKDDGSFTLLKQVHTGLNNLRGFIIDPSGRFLVAGGNVAGGIKIFERTNGGADLVQVAATTQVPTASSFIWL